jgi:proteasome lid subunit RPN8/RPN11
MRFQSTPPPGITEGAGQAAQAMGRALRPGRPLFVWSEAARTALQKHAESSDLEVAGLLAGRALVDADGTAVVQIEAAIPADKDVERSSVHVTFRPTAWDSLSPAIDDAVPGGALVGWYHTHPGLGAFFSSTDRRTQAGAFPQPWQLGLVVDPRSGEEAAFVGPYSSPVRTDDFVLVSPVRSRPKARAVAQIRHSVPEEGAPPTLRGRRAWIAPTAALLILAAWAFRRRSAQHPRSGAGGRARASY